MTPRSFILLALVASGCASDPEPIETETATTDTAPPPLPDLAEIALSEPVGAAMIDGEIAVTLDVVNVGEAPAAESLVDLYFSVHPGDPLEAVLDPADVPAIEPGDVHSAPVTVKVPPFELPVGQVTMPCWLTAVADVDDAVVESDETNNQSEPLELACTWGLPDLEVTEVTGPDVADVLRPGETANIGYTVGNIGQRSPLDMVAGLYDVSLSMVFASDVTDPATWVELGTEPVALTELGPGASATRTLLGTMPPAKATAVGRLGIVVDGPDDLAELDETNNVTWLPGTRIWRDFYPADLEVSAVTVPVSRVRPNELVDVTYDLANLGETAAVGVEARLLLSVDPVLDAGDVVFATIPSADLAPSDGYTVDARARIPGSVPTGRYYVIVQVDPDQTIPQSRTANDVARTASTVLVKPDDFDLTASNVTFAPTTVQAGEPLTVSFDLRNLGTDEVPPFDYDIVISGVPTPPDPWDALLCTETAGSIPAFGTLAVSTTCDLPAFVNPGQWYVAVIVDPGRAVTESDETNNVATAATLIEVRPEDYDLTVSGISTLATTVGAGEALTVDLTVSNEGLDDITNAIYLVVLTTDTWVEPSDPIVCETTIPVVAGQSSVTLTRTCIVPTSTPADTYYVGVMTDPYNDVAETDEWNNAGVSGSTVTTTVPDIDLEPTFVSGPGVARRGSSYTYTIDVQNTGSDGSGQGFQGRLYYTTGSAGGAPTYWEVCTFWMPSIPASWQTTYTVTCTVPSGMVAGTWRLGFSADVDQEIPETDEGNNSIRQPTSTTVL